MMENKTFRVIDVKQIKEDIELEKEAERRLKNLKEKDIVDYNEAIKQAGWKG